MRYFRWIWLLRIITVMVVCLAYLCLWPRLDCIRSLFIYKVDRGNASSIVHCWLLKKDPGIFNHCKVILGTPQEDSEVFGYVRDKGDHIEIMGWVCGER